MSVELQLTEDPVFSQDEAQHEQLDQGTDGPVVIPALPPTDGGPRAWRFLAGCFILEAVLWGKLPFQLPLAVEVSAEP
jgi:hypothetical protein